MRHTRNALEAIVGVDEPTEKIIHPPPPTTVPPNLDNRCYNVFPLGKHGIGRKYSAPVSKQFLDLLISKEEELTRIESAVLKCISPKAQASGTAFAVAPSTLLTNWHVVEKLSPPIIATPLPFPRSYVTQFFVSNQQFLADMAIEQRVEYTGYTLKERTTDETVLITDHPRTDPILGTVADFDLFDLAILSTHYSNQPRVLFVPSHSCIQPLDTIVTLGVPGSDDMDYRIFKGLNLPQAYVDSLPHFGYLKQIFHGFGLKCASVGTVMRPYREQDGEWVEHDIVYSPDNHHAFISNETVFFGNSGGPVVCLEKVHIHSAQDTQGNEWTLVEFFGIHSGGQFINCVDCVHVHPKLRETQEPSSLRACRNCADGGRDQKSLTYNYNISVHHDMFVDVYKKTIVPKLRELFGELPSCIQLYLDEH